MARHLTLVPDLPCAPATGTHCPATGGPCPLTGPTCIGAIITAAGHGRHVRPDDRDEARALARIVTALHDHTTTSSSTAAVLPEAA